MKCTWCCFRFWPVRYLISFLPVPQVPLFPRIHLYQFSYYLFHQIWSYAKSFSKNHNIHRLIIHMWCHIFVGFMSGNNHDFIWGIDKYRSFHIISFTVSNINSQLTHHTLCSGVHECPRGTKKRINLPYWRQSERYRWLNISKVVQAQVQF